MGPCKIVYIFYSMCLYLHGSMYVRLYVLLNAPPPFCSPAHPVVTGSISQYSRELSWVSGQELDVCATDQLLEWASHAIQNVLE